MREYVPLPIPCAACGEPLTAANGRAFFCSTALGDCVLRTCKAGDCADRAVREHPEQPAKRIPERVGKEEREAREKAKARGL